MKIENEGATLKLTQGSNIYYIQKDEIVIRIDGSNLIIYDGNKEYLFPYEEVELPTSSDIEDLAEQIETFLEVEASPLPAGATAAKQDTGNASIASVDSNIGAKADASATSDTGTFSLIALFKRLLAKITAGISAAPIDGTKATYSAAIRNLVLVTGATDFFTITGSATKTVKVVRISVNGVRTVSQNNDMILLKRSTANSGGTSSIPTIVPHDSNSAVATAVVRAYTANPTLGTLAGIMKAFKMFINAVGTGISDATLWEAKYPSQAFTLRGTSEVLSVSFGAQAISGADFDCDIEWTEE